MSQLQCDECGEYMERPDVIADVPGTDNQILECDHCGGETVATRDKIEEAGYG